MGDEKMAERDETMEKIEEWEALKPKLMIICNRWGVGLIYPDNVRDVLTKIQDECEALGIENGNFAALIKEGEAQLERRDGLVAEKEELEMRQVGLQSVYDAETAINRKVLKKYKKLMKKK